MAKKVFADSGNSIGKMVTTALIGAALVFLPIHAPFKEFATIGALIFSALGGLVCYRKIVINEESGYFELHLAPLGWMTEHGPLSEIVTELDAVPHSGNQDQYSVTMRVHGQKIVVKKGSRVDMNKFARQEIEDKTPLRVLGLT